MLAVDTNLVVRYLTADDPEQSAKARAVIDEGDIFVGTTVLLETKWVLRSAYGFPASQVGEALRGFAGLPQITLEAPSAVAMALQWMAAGMDFADALHLAAAERCDAFLTFDRRLRTLAQRLGDIAVRAP